MSGSPHQALLAANVPRPDALVASYAERNTKEHKKMVRVFAAIGLGLWIFAGISMATGRHPEPVLTSFGKALLIMGPISMLMLGPVLLYWSVNRGSLTKTLRHGEILPATEQTRDVVHFRGSQIVRIVAEFNAAVGVVRKARFELPIEEAPPAGADFVVLRRTGTTVVVLWPEDRAVVARML